MNKIFKFSVVLLLLFTSQSQANNLEDDVGEWQLVPEVEEELTKTEQTACRRPSCANNSRYLLARCRPICTRRLRLAAESEIVVEPECGGKLGRCKYGSTCYQVASKNHPKICVPTSSICLSNCTCSQQEYCDKIYIGNPTQNQGKGVCLDLTLTGD